RNLTREFLLSCGLGALLAGSLAGLACAQGALGSVVVTRLFLGGGSPPPPDPRGAQYDRNPRAIADGARLFDWYNCSGCHFHGAGGIGPSLIDTTWAYGGKIDQIYASIYQGRPNGMPSWGAKLSSTEIWELAAYIRDGADKAKSIPIPTTPTEATPIGAARTVDAPSPAITDL